MADEREDDWLQEHEAELRQPVEVRDEWRATVLDCIAGEPVPAREPLRRQRPIRLSIPAALAAALVLTIFGGVLSAWFSRLRPSAQLVSAEATALTPESGDARLREVRFRLAAPTARRVALVGDFNAWNPDQQPMQRVAADGIWTISVRLPPGQHVYAFVVDGGVTADPSAARAVDEDFGAPSSVVVVPASAAR